MQWWQSDRADLVAAKLADRHYNRQTIGSAQFVPPGRCKVFRTWLGDAFWVTSWPFPEHVRHDWPGAWICSAFRNESEHLSSELVKEAVAATASYWRVPNEGFVTFIDPEKTRRKRDPGRCFRRAGFQHVGYTKGGLVVLHLAPEDFPDPEMPNGVQYTLAEALGVA